VLKKKQSGRKLRERLREAEQTLRAIRSGEVDAIVVGGPQGDRVFTLEGGQRDYRVLMDETSEGIATLGKGSLVTYCSQRFASIFGAGPEKIVGRRVDRLIPAQQKHRLTALLKAGLLATSRGEFSLAPDRTVSLSVSKVEMDGQSVVCLIANDVSEERKRDRDAAASEERYRQIVETAVEGIWLVDSEDRTSFANRALCEMLGYTQEELLSRSLFDLMDRESAAAARRLLARRKRFSEMREFGFRTKSGGDLWAVLSMSPIEDGEGKYDGAVVMVSDVSERRKLQAQLLLADRMSSLGTLSAGVAHEINNPLAYVIASLDLMAARSGQLHALGRETADFFEEQLQRAREGAGRVRRIVRDLKSFSRADEETVASTDLRKSLDTSLTLVWNEIKHRARLVKDYDGLPSVRANEARLGQVFINLFVNAAQSMPEGEIEKNELRVTGRTDGLGNAVVEISDTGCGIPPENMDRIFEPFFTTKPVGEGTGLGLAICHGIITSYGGTLSVKSAVGVGTTFRLVLPAAQAETQVQPQARPSPGEQRQGRILIVDDEKDLTDVTRDGLAHLHVVRTTQDARQALEWIAAGEKFDLILCDMMMPLMTGMEFYTRLQVLAPDQAGHVVFMTGGAFTPRAREFLARLPNLRLEKPFDVEHILTLVQQPAMMG
jgi:PAS domain S-box-containing protein